MGRITADAKVEVRNRLLATAAQHFARDGLDRASIDAIASGAGVAKGTIYNYFRSKDDLFAEVIAEGARRAVRRYEANPTTGSTRDRLRALAEADVQVVREQEPFQQVVIREALAFRRETYPLVIEHLAPYVGAVAQVLGEGVTAGDVRSDRPVAQFALAFIGILGILYVQHWGSGGTWPALDEIPDLAVLLFFDGVGQEPGDQG
ncbi:MAG: TetR family transcriptional regulator [Gammaproteobacteria bacterium]|nr:TetR family transcriptional regulator [Gammaproteobacteria bacterium]